MRMKYLVVALIVFTALILAACGGGGVEIDGATLLDERCTECHELDRITSAQKTEAEWDATVTAMVEKGATLTAEEQEVLVAYLAETYGP